MKDPTGPTHADASAEALFREHAGFIASFLHRLGVHEADVDDAVQEVFLTAHRKGGYVAGPAKPRTWLSAIAVRIAANSRRKRKGRAERHYDEAFVEAMSSSGETPAHTIEVARSLARVQETLDTLDVEHRTVFVLYEIEGRSCTEIAEAECVPVGTVYSRLHHARRRFRERHAAHCAREELPVAPMSARGA